MRAVRYACDTANVRRRRAFLTHAGDGGRAAFWRGLFGRVDTLIETNTALAIVADGPHRAYYGQPLSPSRFRIKSAMDSVDALVIQAQTLSSAMSFYFLFRRRLTCPAIVFFVWEPENPGAGTLVRLLEKGRLDGTMHLLSEVAVHPDGRYLAFEVFDAAIPDFTPKGSAPMWSPPAPVAQTRVIPAVRTLIDHIYGYQVLRWYGCFLALRHGTRLDRAEDVFLLPQASCRVEASISALLQSLCLEPDPDSAERADRLAAKIIAQSRTGALSVWGMGSDLLRALIGSVDLKAHFEGGGIRIVDRALAGQVFFGNPIMEPEALTNTAEPIILTAASPGTRVAILTDARSYGIPLSRMVDPYTLPT
ncbi:MAG TPA: hypothetical protein VEB64_06290 [Azospirillaceae bacterium]|nr:hypothetical protein [Azospirillaceae bacterium]